MLNSKNILVMNKVFVFFIKGIFQDSGALALVLESWVFSKFLAFAYSQNSVKAIIIVFNTSSLFPLLITLRYCFLI